jgi:hypothetical protein
MYCNQTGTVGQVSFSSTDRRHRVARFLSIQMHFSVMTDVINSQLLRIFNSKHYFLPKIEFFLILPSLKFFRPGTDVKIFLNRHVLLKILLAYDKK